MIQREAFAPMLRTFLTDFDHLDGADPHLSLTCSHDAVDAAVERLAASPVGAWIRAELQSCQRPDHTFVIGYAERMAESRGMRLPMVR
jgi:hypothetical protein